MKHLKIEVGVLFNKKYLRIVEQTHRNGEFVGNGYVFVASNGFELRSDFLPEIVGNEPLLYVRGSKRENDFKTLEIPSEEWLKRLTIAVKEYNEEFANCESASLTGVQIIE